MKIIRGVSSASALLNIVVSVALISPIVLAESTAAATTTVATSAAATSAAATSAAATSAAATSAAATSATASSAAASSAAASSAAATSAAATSSSTTSSSKAVYPTAIVPPTADAPFMHSSNLPEGTVFIAVASILAFFAVAVVAWRAVTVWSLRRAVKRAALQHTGRSDKQTLFSMPAVPLYQYMDREPSPSRKSKRKQGGLGTVSTSSLFFSPTAGAANSGMGTPGTRSSSYLPAGYYAAGATVPGNGTGLAHLGRESISLSNLGPQVQGYSRTRSSGPTPPESPNFLPGHSHNDFSSSTLDLGPLPNGRTPSAVLDEFFDGRSNAPPNRRGAS